MAAFNEQFREEFRHGSARWATPQEMKPLRRAEGLAIGFDKQGRVLRHPGDAPALILAGSGAGKARDAGQMYNACTYPGNIFGIDIKGEFSAVSGPNQVRLGKFSYFINATRMHGIPHHPCDPLDILTALSATLILDGKMIAEALIPPTGSKDKYFEDKAKALLDAVMVADAEMNGRASLRRLYKIISSISSDPDYWIAFVERVAVSCYEHVRRVIAELLFKLREAPKEGGAILGEATKALSFADDPAFLAGLDKPAFSLSVLCERPCNVYLICPADYLGVWASYVRLLVTVAMAYKSRKPQAPSVVFMIDECGQLGAAPFVLRAMTFGRGAKIVTQLAYQDIGQIISHYGREGVQTIFGSSQVQQIFGVRDIETAELVSRTLGNETLSVDPLLEQSAARVRQTGIIRELMNGADPFDAGQRYGQQERASVNRTKMMRPLMTGSEVLAMPPDREIIRVSGIDCPNVAGYMMPFYMRRELAGQFHPNPYHPPLDRVRLRGRFGMKWARVITEPVPRCFAHYPQYQDGYWSYIEGYRPPIT